MNKTMRKVVAFAATAAMAVSLIPSAFAGSASYLLIDAVGANKTEFTGTRVNTELASALSQVVTDYDNGSNTLLVKRLPANMPYIRPQDYCSDYVIPDSFNYAPYLPLSVNLSFWNGEKQKFMDFSKATMIKVDGVEYAIKVPQVAAFELTKAQIAWLLFAKAGVNMYDAKDDTVPPVAVFTGSGALNTDADYKLPLLAGNDADPAIAKNLKEEATAAYTPMVEALAKYFYDPGVPASLLYSAATTRASATLIASDLYSKSTVDVKGLIRAIDKLGGNSDVVMDTIEYIANETVKNFDLKTLGDNERMAENFYKCVIGLLKSAAVEKVGANLSDVLYNKSVDSNNKNIFANICVFHNLRENPETHKIEVTIGGKTYERSFQVKNSGYESPYSIADAKRIPTYNSIASINYENVLVKPNGGSLFIEFSQQDLIATDTWGTPSSKFRLWDRSNKTLSGTWMSFQPSVLEGHTVFFESNALLKNAKNEVIPAGTELELVFNQKINPSNLQEATYQYSNKYTVKVKDDNTIDFQLALDKYDMQWLFNGHFQNYVRVDFTKKGDSTYAGSFYVTFSSSNRATTGVTFVEGERITMKVGETKNINAVLSSSAMSTKINTFVSATPSVATVSKTGDLTATVTAVKLGTTVITATTANGEYGQIVVDVVADEPVITAKTYKVVTTSSALNVRSGAGTSYGIIGKLSKGSTFQGELNAAGDWVKLNYNGQTGYVSAKYVIAQ